MELEKFVELRKSIIIIILLLIIIIMAIFKCYFSREHITL